MIITRKDFQAYLKIQHSGKYNMYSQEAKEATGLDYDLYEVIQLTWEDLNSAFIGTNINHVSITIYDKNIKEVKVKTLKAHNINPNLALTYEVFGGQADCYIGSIEYVPAIGAVKLHSSPKELDHFVHVKDLLLFPDNTIILIDWYDGFEAVTHFQIDGDNLNLYRRTSDGYNENDNENC